jgi:glycosyltransferase involved in cell wall biosynthesis
MKISIQAGNLGGSIIDHLISPLARAKSVTNILLLVHNPGPIIPKVKYYCPLKFLVKFTLTAVIYEFFNLLYLALFRSPTHLAGYLLFPHGLIAFIVAKLTRKPIIISLIAGPVELYSIGGSPLGVNYKKPLPWNGRLFLQIMRHSDAIITTGSFTKDFLVNHGIQEFKIYPMISPPNKSRFKPLEVPKIYDILSVGRLTPVKHNEVMVRTIYKVKEKYPDIKACIVGGGPCKPEITRLANELGIKENVDFVGVQKNVAYFYNSARIFIHTSEREGFPNVVLEAMLCGLPCVVSNCGDIIDIAKDGFNSLVIQKFNDYEGFAKAITNLLQDEELYHNLSQNALKTMELLSAEDVTRRWEMILATK